jgi:branched-chain amino acid transport system ATP-binding protein
MLKIESVSKAFGGLQALWNVSFDVSPGTIQGVIGPNGAGKTTLFNLISGADSPDRGRIVYGEEEIQGQGPERIVATGIARTFQNVALFENMSVVENVLVGGYVRTACGFWSAMLRTPGMRREEDAALEKAHDLLSFVGLGDHADKRSGDLAFGWQRLLEIARALASAPGLLLLDEPAAGLNAVETHALGELLFRIRDRGITLLLVEHDMNLAMGICDRILVLDQGKVLASGTPRQIQSDEAVLTAYLGRKR